MVPHLYHLYRLRDSLQAGCVASPRAGSRSHLVSHIGAAPSVVACSSRRNGKARYSAQWNRDPVQQQRGRRPHTRMFFIRRGSFHSRHPRPAPKRCIFSPVRVCGFGHAMDPFPAGRRGGQPLTCPLPTPSWEPLVRGQLALWCRCQPHYRAGHPVCGPPLRLVY